MKILIILFSIFLIVTGSPIKSPDGIELMNFFLSMKSAADKLDSFPWIKASKAKARFGSTTTTPRVTTLMPPQNGDQPEIQPVLTKEMLQSYIATLTAQLQPYVIQDPTTSAPTTSPLLSMNTFPAISPKKSWKGKVPKQIKPEDVPQTTQAYWIEEKKVYPDSFYDDFYMDWLKKRQIEEIQVATPTPYTEQESEISSPSQPSVPAKQAQSPYPAMPMSPYMMNPFMYPLAGFKISKAMAQAQVNAALAAMNITTTQKPVKIKLKIPIPAGDDLATVVANGISSFPAGTTYELSKK